MMRLPRGLSLVVVLAVLALTGWVTQGLGEPAWRQVRAMAPALNMQALEGSLGQGLTFGLLGGFRAVMADFLWVKTNTHWEARDLPGTQKMIDLVTTVDPRPLYFWINGARMIAYDMPVWRAEALAGGPLPLPEVAQRRIDEEQAQAALRLLERALSAHPGQPLLLLEAGNIHLRRRQDPVAAATFYRRAAETPGAPFYAGRIYAELLKKLGRWREAYDWLRALHPTLPRDNPQANADLVLERVRELEMRLAIGPEDRYIPPTTR